MTTARGNIKGHWLFVRNKRKDPTRVSVIREKDEKGTRNVLL